MTDPFESLHQPASPSAPRAAFADALQARVERALKGTDMTSDNLSGAKPAAYGNLFYFTIPTVDADRANTFYSALFGWELHKSPSGWNIGNTSQPGGINAEGGPEATPNVFIVTDDADATARRVSDLGGAIVSRDTYATGANLSCVDDQGTRFSLIVPAPDYDHPPRYGESHGDLFYWTLPVHDGARAKEFWSQMIGWEFGDTGSAGGMHVENMETHGGLGAGRGGHTPDLFFRVDDAHAAAALVAELGGHAEEPMESPEGTHVMCTDDQGFAFAISQPAEGY